MHDQNKRLTILTEKEIEALYALPRFTPEERESFFSLDPVETKLLNRIRHLNAAVYFLLQLGYFKAKNQFFVFELYEAGDDVVYLLRRYFPDVTKLPALTVSKPTRLSQQTQILKLLNFQTCSPAWKRKLQEQAERLVTIYSKPGYLFKELLNFLAHHRVVLPGYSFMQEEVVGKALTGERKRLEQALTAGIPEEERRKLDRLLTAEESLYQLTLLKHEPKDFSYQEVQKEVEKRALLTDLYQLSSKLLPSLRLSSENIKYYASIITYRPVREIKRMSRETAHAYLLCFISYRYQMAQDNLVNTFLYHVNRFIEDAKDDAKAQIARERLEANRHLAAAGRVLALFTDETIPDGTDFGTVKEQAFRLLKREQFALLARYLKQVTPDETAYEWQQYVRLSLKFKLSLRHLVVAIPFESQRKDDPLLPVVSFLRAAFSRGKSLRDFSSRAFPTQCIPERLKKYLYELKDVPWYGKTKKRRVLNVDKYEFLIYKLLKKGMDAGELFIRDSSSFKSLEEDLVDGELWEQKDALIKSLNTPYLEEPIERILAQKEAELEARIRQVNDRIQQGENPDMKVSGSGEQTRWHLTYRGDLEPVDHPLYSRLPQLGIVDVLLFVHEQTGCFTPFTHLVSRYAKEKPVIPLLAACMIALGENIGPRNMAEMSDIPLQELLTALRDFFRLETLRPANDLIINAATRLSVFDFYNIDAEVIHGSMDGSKLDTRIETFNARHSPKYFMLGKGISSIALIANHFAPNARIIGAHEHESYFAYDLLYNNTSEVDPRILSTDSHGINQVNHMILDVFDYQFSPRYVNLNYKTADIYGFHEPGFYSECIVRPFRKINTRLIIEEWDSILRILVSLGLKTTTQATIIRKLSSHLRKNRTKKAMWEFDNIVKSIDKLRYIDSLAFRQHVQKALNRGEAFNRLKRTVFHDNGGKFRVRTELEQNIWSECTRFIANAIVYCNAYIQSVLYEAAIKAGRYEDAKRLKRISPIAWRHINLRGRFEFQERHKAVDISEIARIFEQKFAWQELQAAKDILA